MTAMTIPMHLEPATSDAEKCQVVDRRVIVQFRDGQTDQLSGSQMELPIGATTSQLAQVVRSLTDADERTPYSFFLGDDEIMDTIEAALKATGTTNTEMVLSVVYQPQAVFRVRSVGRCTSTLPGHTDAILCVQFSPDGKHLATCSGDKTVRLWEVNAEMPSHTLRGHKNWVLIVAWSPDGTRLASGSKDGAIYLWNPMQGVASPRKPLLRGHTKWVTSLSWEPMHLPSTIARFASGSKDGTVKTWNAGNGALERSFSGHTAGVTCVRWGGAGHIYSASQDRTIHVWNADEGTLARRLVGHAHWVNNLSLSTDYALRTGAFDHHGRIPDTPDLIRSAAFDRYKVAEGGSGNGDAERLVSCSDDFTLFLWNPSQSDKPVARMTGHQQPVNDLSYSPDGRMIASASFDHSIRLWDGKTGRFVATLRGHVQAVYSLAWSADSRLLATSSRDSTVKVWEVRTKKLLQDLPGHADEVFALDWSPDGDRVASGGKDRVVKFWRR